MEIQIRTETESDYRTVEELTKAAFWNQHAPGCDEHYLVHVLRSSAAFISELAFVAEGDGRLIGNIMYTRALIKGDDGQDHPVLCFGPISVLPEFQGQGVGRMLIEHSKEAARKLGFTAVLIYGDPDFYQKHGFTAAENYGIGTSWDAYAVPLLACELIPGALDGCAGRFFEDPVFEIDSSASADFDADFPQMEKKSDLPSQVRFAELITMNRPRQLQ